MAEAFFSIRKKIQTEYEKQKELEGNKKESNSQIEDNTRSIQQLWKSTNTKNTTLIAKVSQAFHPIVATYTIVESSPGYFEVLDNTSSLYVANPVIGYSYWSRVWSPASIFGGPYYPHAISGSWSLIISRVKEIEIPTIDIDKYAINITCGWSLPESMIDSRLKRYYYSYGGNPGWRYGVIGNDFTTYPEYTIVNNRILYCSIGLTAKYYNAVIAGDCVWTAYIYATEL